MAYIVTKDSIIGDVLDYDSSVADIFFGIGMHCVGCPASRGETIEEAQWFTVLPGTNRRKRSTLV